MFFSEQRRPSSATPANNTKLVGWLFFRGLAIIYFAAFASLAIQIEGLIGSQGILPIKNTLLTIEQHFPDSKWWRFPTLFWVNHSDTFLLTICYISMASALLLLLKVATRINLIFCFILYLSLTLAALDFTAFQWDELLLETGFLAILLTWRSRIIVFLFRWLLARFMFMSGLVKIMSGDPSWINLTALTYHYETQPLPSPLAYYAHHLPDSIQQLSVTGVLFIELIVPFFVFLPRPFRLFAAWSFIGLQCSILLTGNYTFFNLLTILLCLFLFEDRDIEKIIPAKLRPFRKQTPPPPGVLASFTSATWAVIILTVCFTKIWMGIVNQLPGAPLRNLIAFTTHFSLVNNYGPFATMTKTRPEIIIEGSDDGINWREYSFKYKPGDIHRPLTWVIPHQPRLDWQMWFAALTPPGNLPWFDNFMQRLQSGSPPVLALLNDNPFPNAPPAMLRARLYQYTYTSLEQRSKDDQIWIRQYQGPYWPRNF